MIEGICKANRLLLFVKCVLIIKCIIWTWEVGAHSYFFKFPHEVIGRFAIILIDSLIFFIDSNLLVDSIIILSKIVKRIRLMIALFIFIIIYLCSVPPKMLSMNLLDRI